MIVDREKTGPHNAMAWKALGPIRPRRSGARAYAFADDCGRRNAFEKYGEVARHNEIDGTPLGVGFQRSDAKSVNAQLFGRIKPDRTRRSAPYRQHMHLAIRFR